MLSEDFQDGQRLQSVLIDRAQKVGQTYEFRAMVKHPLLSSVRIGKWRR